MKGAAGLGCCGAGDGFTAGSGPPRRELRFAGISQGLSHAGAGRATKTSAAGGSHVAIAWLQQAVRPNPADPLPNCNKPNVFSALC